MNQLFVLLVTTFLRQRIAAKVETLDQVDNLVADLKDAYYDKQSIIPKQNVTLAISVDAEFSLTAFKSVDVAAGQIAISGYLTLSWTDERFYSYTIENVTEDVLVMLPSNSIWTPDMTLVNAVSSAQEASSSSTSSTATSSSSSVDLMFNFRTAGVTWKRWVFPTGVCKMDNYYFPFEIHECSFRYGSLGYASDKLELYTSSSALDLSDFTENSDWSLEETTSNTYVENSHSFFRVTLKLKRKSSYTAVRILLPTILFAVLSVCSFLTPVGHSNRTVFSGIMLLITFVLFLYNTTLVPASSVSVPLLIVFLFLELFYSAGVALLSVISVRIGSKSDLDPIPGWLTTVVSFVTIFAAYIRCNASNTVEPNTDVKALSDNHDKVRNLHMDTTELRTKTPASFWATNHRAETPGGAWPGGENRVKTPASALRRDQRVRLQTLDKDWTDEQLSLKSANISERMPIDGSIAGDTEDGHMTWAEIGTTLDYLFMFLLLLIQIILCLGILIPLSQA